MNTNIDLTQFDDLKEGKEVIYEYDGEFFYQHLEDLCKNLSERCGHPVQWVADPTNPYGLPRYIVSLLDPNASKQKSKEFDYLPFDGLRDDKPVLYYYQEKRYIRHLDQLCRKLSEHYKTRIEWKNADPQSVGDSAFILFPSRTRYPKLLDADLKKFRYQLDFYDSEGNKAHTKSGGVAAKMPLEWYFYEICLSIQVAGYGTVHIRTNKAARDYFGRPKSFIDALYDGVEMIRPEALDGIVTIHPDGDDNIWVAYRGPDDDFWDDDDDFPPEDDPTPDGGITLIIESTIIKNHVKV